LELPELAKFKFGSFMFIEIEIPFHEFTFFIREMKMKWKTLDPDKEFGDF
jgi:hypothetical protein